LNIASVYERFPSEDECLDYLEAVRWPQGAVCPYCGSMNTTPMPKERRHHCNACNTSFSVTVRTIFHRTHLPLQKWFLALSLTLNARKGLSARQLGRDLGVTKDTAWRIAMKIREAMAETEQRRLLNGLVEMDETYLGARRPRRRPPNDKTPRPPQGRATNRPTVVGMMERGGEVRAKVTKKGGLSSKNLNALVRANVDIEGATLVTDEFGGYFYISTFMPHMVVRHKVWYVDGEAHTNSIESFWALLKRGLVGQYHKVSLRYLPRYIDEFSYRFNHRNDADVFDRTLARGLGVV
jgi:transposase-like protein